MRAGRSRWLRVVAAAAVLSVVGAGCGVPPSTELFSPSPSSTAVATGPPATATARPTDIPPTPVIEVPSEFQDEGRVLYLDSGSVRVGVDTLWGGAIREIWFGGENLVNNYDGGRLIAVSFYDSYQPATTDHPNDTGWNPTPSDMHNAANPPLEVAFQEGTLYLKNRYLQWFPNDKGGGPGAPVETDVLVETWIRFFTDPQIIHLRYRVTNEGGQVHGVHSQEFPFAYPRTPFHTYVTYSGEAPWTEDEALLRDMPMDAAAAGQTVARERWAGMVNAEGVGLVMWAPQAYPFFSYTHFNNAGPVENDSLYLLPGAYLAIGPRDSIETEAFLLLGGWQDARRQIYDLNQHFSFPDVMDPFGHVDLPQPGVEVGSNLIIDGWAIDDRGIDRIEVLVDGEVVGPAAYGHPRPDVEQGYPGLTGEPGHGFRYELDTAGLTSGSHTLELVAVDHAGNRSVLRPGPIEFRISG